jgi:Pertussis toxin, subunit 1
LLVAGWFLPGLEPEWWTIVLSRGAGGTGLPPVLLSGYVDAFSALFRGGSLSEVQRHQVDVVVPPPDFRAGLLLSIVAGLVVFPLVVAALPEGAAIASLTAAFGGSVLAGLAAGAIVAACAGVLAGVSAAVAQRFVLALTDDLAWDEVLDEKVLARDAVLGGMLNAASFGVGQAIGATKTAIRATKDAKRLGELRRELEVLEETQTRLVAKKFGQATKPPKAVPLVFRGDGRQAVEIFENGITARNPAMSLEEHLAGGNGFISASKSKFVANGFAVQNKGLVYVIDDVGNGTKVVYPKNFKFMSGEQEVLFTRIEPSQIRGAFTPKGEWIPNPGYVG